ncbi:MAG: hypothetical protein Fur0016_01060 [Anaerolineales bacterium]
MTSSTLRITIAAGVFEPEVYLYSQKRWWLRDQAVYPDPLEYWIIEREDGSLQLAENIPYLAEY